MNEPIDYAPPLIPKAKKAPSAFFAVLNTLVGACLTAIPTLFVVVSDKSPLRSHDAAFINGFVLGMGFVFATFAGILLLAGGIRELDRRSSRSRSA